MTHSPASGRTTHSPAAGPILVLNGPNLNMLGTRQPEVYGAATLDDVVELCTRTAATFGHEVVTFQSNYEGALIERIHRARGAESGIVINPGGLTHTSVALRDALVIPELPIVEVHISNVHAREQFRHHSYISPIATAVIAGMGIHGYAAAIEFLSRSRRLDRPSTSNRG
ncbi:type II 3-dehydroquinate dehydratase [Nocardia sp. CNY236]|uniref:type II 3-dehydroquinate dehydratase n=1 Tax=Nocardia sp. CNY236 TaxID=1169152 RepID=UPI00068743E0|nr:type II 3-dehydroquinate dehydratase [Nocardia sp. CNY236]